MWATAVGMVFSVKNTDNLRKLKGNAIFMTPQYPLLKSYTIYGNYL